MTTDRAKTGARGEVVLRLVPHLTDINANGHIFGGWVLSQMDIAGGIVAGRIAQGAVATVAIESMTFITPILLGDVVSVYAVEERRGRTSVAIRIDVVAIRGSDMEEVLLTSGVYTFVALDANHRPRPLPDA
ncbi:MULTISPECIES: acyl-CoA thioesterase [Sphingobium]|uniref:Acyl-CoA hydrolase n=2 Tax=Sphingobium cupriresistens TaxID=1132417 RepID=A0A0J7XR84_9SPHN|nr:MULTISPECIES: hotdog domain-containing protein [Sphingobium]KMS54154.1 acyl-CoA hydrolase [Sphingobium cupriresistens LL01]MBJ7376837.1 acyl-CoA thioesterase [Sphingobium sp.]RYM14422.1 acyl-CoA thioesterase [Sphingobium cupriresistens]WCP13662.1 putative acyl-CoA thioester hydrolase [Sphingobium sp. AntQ-1]